MVHIVLSAYITISPTGSNRLVRDSSFVCPNGTIKSETQVPKILTISNTCPFTDSIFSGPIGMRRLALRH